MTGQFKPPEMVKEVSVGYLDFLGLLEARQLARCTTCCMGLHCR